MATETLLHRWFEEVWNQGRESAIDELMETNSVFHGIADPGSNEVRGREAFKSFYQQYRKAFPDIHFTIEDALIDGDKIAVRCVVRATHTGEGITDSPTNKPVTLTGMVIPRVKDGKLVEGWNNFDFLTLFQQLGMKLV
jgi:predicted ester cyclase